MCLIVIRCLNEMFLGIRYLVNKCGAVSLHHLTAEILVIRYLAIPTEQCTTERGNEMILGIGYLVTNYRAVLLHHLTTEKLVIRYLVIHTDQWAHDLMMCLIEMWGSVTASLDH